MKNRFKVFGLIAFVAIVMFSITACPEDEVKAPPSLNGSWHNDHWSETFTFTIALGASSGTFTKMNDAHWGEKGTFTLTATDFTTTKTHLTDDGINWNPVDPLSDDLIHIRDYALSGNTLMINGVWEYTKQ